MPFQDKPMFCIVINNDDDDDDDYLYLPVIFTLLPLKNKSWSHCAKHFMNITDEIACVPKSLQSEG